MQSKKVNLIRPGLFGSTVAADNRRNEFDLHNEVILNHEIPVDFIFFGDSITHKWDLQSYFGRFGKSVVNRGIGGDVTTYARKRFLADVVQLHPTYVVILIGINNTWVMEHWNPSESKTQDEITHEITTDIAAMVEMAQEAGIKPIVCSILPTSEHFKVNLNVRNKMIKRINEQLKELATEKSALYIDYHSQLTEADGLTLRAGIAKDGLHPGLDGYDIMAHVLRTELAKHDIEI